MINNLDFILNTLKQMSMEYQEGGFYERGLQEYLNSLLKHLIKDYFGSLDDLI